MALITDFQIVQQISDHPTQAGLVRNVRVLDISIQLEGKSRDADYRNLPAPFVTFRYQLEHVGIGIAYKDFKKGDNTDLVDPITGRKIAKLREDTREGSETFGQMVTDWEHNPILEEFVAFANKGTNGLKWWEELSAMITDQITVMDEQQMFDRKYTI